MPRDTIQNILLVEDEIIIAMAGSRMLEKNGYNVVVAGSGEESVRIMNSGADIDIIIMDIDLGKGINGTEAAEAITSGRHVPVVFMSSHAEPETLALIEKTRSYGYILKGSPDQVVISSIRQAFNLFRDRMKELSLNADLVMEKQRQASIIDGTNTGTWEWNIVTGEVLLNERWAGMLGYTLDELSPVSIDTWIRLTHPDDFKNSAGLLESHFSGETDYYETELRMRHREGPLGLDPGPGPGQLLVRGWRAPDHAGDSS
jgi:CheY-like chemotaxis protein